MRYTVAFCQCSKLSPFVSEVHCRFLSVRLSAVLLTAVNCNFLFTADNCSFPLTSANCSFLLCVTKCSFLHLASCTKYSFLPSAAKCSFLPNAAKSSFLLCAADCTFLICATKCSFMIRGRSRVRVPAGAAGEFSSAGSTLCADSYSVSVPQVLILPIMQIHVDQTHI